MNPCIIIPARYNSSRFPGKVLVDILGKTVLTRVWEKCIKAVSPENVYVATDDERISNYCIKNKIKYILTSSLCKTGTDRVAEASRVLKEYNYNPIINVQGDEPLVSPDSIKKIITSFNNEVLCGYSNILSNEEFISPNIIKIVIDNFSYLLYASRAAIPTTKMNDFIAAYKQVCIYAFSYEHLDFFSNNPNKSKLESIEDIEFLRFLENGYKIKMIEVSDNSYSVDIPSDINKIIKVLNGE